MLMLRGAIRTANILSRVSFRYNQPPRNPSIPTQNQFMLPYSINFLHDNKGAVRYPKRIGRGPGSGKGKTSTRGHKGQLARSGGKIHPRFEGGQTPITQRLPKYGRVFKAKSPEILTAVNLKLIDYYVKTGVLDPTQQISIRTLVRAGIVKNVKYGVKLLARGLEKINYPLKFEVTDASKKVIQSIHESGGQIKLIHRTPLKLREHIFPEKYLLPLREPITPWWKVQKLQRKQAARGIKIEYCKPAWMQKDPIEKKQQRFVYPVPRVSNPEKVRKRKIKLFKKITYKI